MNTGTFNVKLVSITAPEVRDSLGYKLTPEEFIAYAARVSNPKNQLNTATAPKLLKFLLDNSHYSPFEQVDLGVEIQTSRGISPQIIRHFSFSFQEFSQRYSQAQEAILYPARRQDTENRQNSIDDLPQETKDWFEQQQVEIWDKCSKAYNEAILKNIALEQARFLLPLNTKTTLYMKGNVRDWIFYLKLRKGNGTQKEHSDIANAIIDTIFVPKFPNISKALGWVNEPQE